jgi:hypothetical protein
MCCANTSDCLSSLLIHINILTRHWLHSAYVTEYIESIYEYPSSFEQGSSLPSANPRDLIWIAIDSLKQTCPIPPEGIQNPHCLIIKMCNHKCCKGTPTPNQ